MPILIAVCLFLAFNAKTYTSKENLPCLILLMLLYGWSTIPLMYPLNYLFQLPSTAFVVASSLNVFIGVITTMTTTVIDSLAADEPELVKINNILKPIFTIFFPHYCLGQGFITMTLLYTISETNGILGRDRSYDPFLFKNVGQNLLAMAVQGVVFFIFNLLLQYKFFIRIKPTKNFDSLNLPESVNEDSDVAEEKQRILSDINENSAHIRKKFNLWEKFKFLNKNLWSKNQIFAAEMSGNTSSDKDYIRLVNLTKVFRKVKKFKIKKHAAVNNLSLGINKGECFGLIGVNGAGIEKKQTILKFL
jgi:ABC-type multidrug transport system fused ATPase/permease subunit